MGAMLRVAVLEGNQGNAASDSLVDLLRMADGVEAHHFGSLSALIVAVEQERFDAVVADPFLAAEGWTVPMAAKLDETVAAHLPVVVVCRSESDVRIIRERARHLGPVLVRDEVDADGLAKAVSKAVAGRQASI